MRSTRSDMDTRGIKALSIADKLGGTYRVAASGTPHVLITYEGITYSVCYFTANKGRPAAYKVFWPYPSRGEKQKRRKFSNEAGVVAFFDSIVLSHLGVI